MQAEINEFVEPSPQERKKKSDTRNYYYAVTNAVTNADDEGWISQAQSSDKRNVKLKPECLLQLMSTTTNTDFLVI